MEIKAAGGDHRALRKIARTLLDKAENGDLSSIREVADRLDGKAIEAVSADVELTTDPLQQLFDEIAARGRSLRDIPDRET